MELSLYSYWRSPASHRVRIALSLKNIPYSVQPVDICAGEQHRPEYLAVNPQGLVPALVVSENGVAHTISQSLAIIEFMEETFPTRTPLLPRDPIRRARAREIAQIAACDIQPLATARVCEFLFEHDTAREDLWREDQHIHWVRRGIRAAEEKIRERAGPYCLGAHPTLADVVLIPEIYALGAAREAVLREYPTIRSVYRACNEFPKFRRAAPHRHPGAPRR